MLNNRSLNNIEALEELTFDGHGSGLEVETPMDDDGDIKSPFDPKQIDVITQQRTVDLLLARLDHEELDLSPDFQRRANLWNDTRKSSLIESMLLRIPIPSLYISEDHDGNYQVVDGLQRLCAIAHFVKVSNLNKALNTTLNPLRLSGLQALCDLERKAFEELPRQLQRRINETELTLHIIRAGTPTDVKFNIFSRINQGGYPLNAQEIRNAIFRGKWKSYVRKLAVSKAFISATENKIKGERLEDHELILRFIALYAQPNNAKRHSDENLDKFLNDFVEKHSITWNENKWQEITDAFHYAMEAAPKIFKRIVFRKYSEPNKMRCPINRGLFESESVAVAKKSKEEINVLINNSEIVIDKFGEAMEINKDFRNSLLYATGRGWASNKRLEVIENIFLEVLNAR
jgi:hypothetical protein